MKHFLAVDDFSRDEILELLALARRKSSQSLKGKTLGLVFQKPSARTRISFEMSMRQLGGDVIALQDSEIGLGRRESVEDVALLFSRYMDAVALRVRSHTDLEEFARYSTVPVINALSDLHHPCQAMADMLTIQQKKKQWQDATVCYVGDGNNVCRSLVMICSILGVKIVVSSPKKYMPDVNGYAFDYIQDPAKAVVGADVVYTDAWVSMGQEAEHMARVEEFSGYRVTADLLKKAKKDVIFMHCMPVHYGEEADREVSHGSHSVMIDQAENRLHVQRAILAHLIKEK